MLALAPRMCAALQDTEEYKTYCREREIIGADEDLTLRLYRFRKRAAAFRQSDSPALDDEKEVAAMYHELRRNPHVRSMFDAESAIVSAVMQAFEMVCEAGDLEIVM